MSWQLVIEIEWPRVSTPNMEELIREVVDPLHRENVDVLLVSLVQVPEPR